MCRRAAALAGSHREASPPDFVAYDGDLAPRRDQAEKWPMNPAREWTLPKSRPGHYRRGDSVDDGRFERSTGFNWQSRATTRWVRECEAAEGRDASELGRGSGAGAGRLFPSRSSGSTQQQRGVEGSGDDTSTRSAQKGSDSASAYDYDKDLEVLNNDQSVYSKVVGRSRQSSRQRPTTLGLRAVPHDRGTERRYATVGSFSLRGNIRCAGRILQVPAGS